MDLPPLLSELLRVSTEGTDLQPLRLELEQVRRALEMAPPLPISTPPLPASEAASWPREQLGQHSIYIVPGGGAAAAPAGRMVRCQSCTTGWRPP